MTVDPTSLERIRNATFPMVRRGYDRAEVEKFLARLADWLETGGGDQSRSEAVKRELERVGQRTVGILSQAEESAQQIRDEAADESKKALAKATAIAATTISEADSHLDETRMQADSYDAETRTGADEYDAETRARADAYDTETRAVADAYDSETRAGAEAYSADTHAGADEYVAETRQTCDRDAAEARRQLEQEIFEATEEAQQTAKTIVDEGLGRRHDIEAVISDLIRRRDAVLAQVDALSRQLNDAVAEHRSGPAADSFDSGEDLQDVEGGGELGSAEGLDSDERLDSGDGDSDGEAVRAQS